MVAETGNTIPPPPRLRGSWDVDYGAIVEWLNQIYQVIGIEQNVTGTQTELLARVAELETANADLTARTGVLEEAVQGIAGLEYLPGPVSGTYDPADLTDAFNKVNAIIEQARGL